MNGNKFNILDNVEMKFLSFCLVPGCSEWTTKITEWVEPLVFLAEGKWKGNLEASLSKKRYYDGTSSQLQADIPKLEVFLRGFCTNESHGSSTIVIVKFKSDKLMEILHILGWSIPSYINGLMG